MEKDEDVSIDDLVPFEKVSKDSTTARILRHPSADYKKAHNSRVSAGLFLKKTQGLSKEEIFEVFDKNVPTDYSRDKIRDIIDSL